jgi:hypothetical protein
LLSPLKDLWMWSCVCVCVCACVRALTNNIFLHWGGLTKSLYVIRQDSFLSSVCFNYTLFSFYMFDHSTVWGMDI